MTDNKCTQCGAIITNGNCDYCGWNSPAYVESRTLTLRGITSDLIVTKETCTFNKKVGSPAVIRNTEISQVSLAQAPSVGTGEMVILTKTGIKQGITFLATQNVTMGEIASYLMQVVPDVQFNNPEPKEAERNIDGIVCPKCRSNNTRSSGASRKVTIWKIVVGVLLLSSAFGVNSGGFAPRLIVIVGGIALVVTGLGLAGRKKSDCLCLNCGKRFRV